MIKYDLQMSTIRLLEREYKTYPNNDGVRKRQRERRCIKLYWGERVCLTTLKNTNQSIEGGKYSNKIRFCIFRKKPLSHNNNSYYFGPFRECWKFLLVFNLYKNFQGKNLHSHFKDKDINWFSCQVCTTGKW